MSRITYLLFLIFLLSSCKLSPPKKIQVNDVNFSCPASWKVTEQIRYGNLLSYTILEEKGLNSSGVIFISWYEDEFSDNNLDEVIEDYQETYSSSFILKKSNIVFEKTEEDEFNGIPSRHSNYNLRLLYIEHEGKLIAFNHKGKTFTITLQSAISDLPENIKAFNFFEESLRIKEKT